MKKKHLIDSRIEFETLAPFYDTCLYLTGLLFGGEKRFREKLIRFMDLRAGHKVIDVACGTGTSTILMQNIVGATGEVVGLDLSHEMIKRAKEKERGKRVLFILGNSENIPFPKKSFDRAHIVAALHEMKREVRHNTLGEIYRILKDDGKLLIADYNKPDGFLKKRLFKALMFFETENAVDMTEHGLEQEIKDGGFNVEKRSFPFGSIGQAILAIKLKKVLE